MRSFFLSLVLGAVALGAVALTPSKADAFWQWGWGGRAYYPAYTYSYYPSYYGVGYPAYYGYSYPSYTAAYTYPSWNSYTVGNVRYINPGYNTIIYSRPGYTYTPFGYYYYP